MEIINKVRNNTKKIVTSKIINLLGNASDKNLIRLSYIAERLARKEDKSKIRKIRKLLKQKHPVTNLIKNILTRHDPNCVNKFVNNLIIKGFLINTKWRENMIKRGYSAPYTILISPTMRCNLNCEGCYANQYNKEDLSFELMNGIIEESKEMKVAFFTILGGEPFLRRDLFKLFEKHKDCYFQVYTNGTLINEKICKELSKVGNVLPVLSLEGFEEYTDKRRSKGIYKKVLDVMDLLRKNKVLFGYSVCVTRKNVEVIFSDEFIDLMINKGAIIGWYFLYMPICKGNVNLMPTPKQRVYMLDRKEYIRENKPIFIVDFWNDAPYVKGCIAGKYYVHITSDGYVEPCIFSHFAVDNIKDKALKECLNSEFFKEIRRKQPYNKNLHLPCMWIDNPEVSRELYEKFNPRPTHEGAMEILTNKKLKEAIDNYSKEVKKLYKDKI